MISTDRIWRERAAFTPIAGMTERPSNRIGHYRKRRGWSLELLAEEAGTSATQVHRLEVGKQRLNEDWLVRLSRALGVAPGDLLPGSRDSVPITLSVASSFSEEAPRIFDRTPPFDYIPVLSTVREPEQCFACEVLDDSADRIYPRGSIVIARELDGDVSLPAGTKVVVRHYRTERRAADTSEVLIGLLDRNVAGDLQIVTRSGRRDLPATIIIQPASRLSGSRFDASSETTGSATIRYEPRANDPAEIIGVVVMAVTPE